MVTPNDEPLSTRDALDAVLKHLSVHHRTAEAATQNRIDAVDMARKMGATWDEVGAAMNMTRQAAHKRFGKLTA
jgi:hypothetical protein